MRPTTSESGRMNGHFPQTMGERASMQDRVGRGEQMGEGTAFVQKDWNVTVSASWRRSLGGERRERCKGERKAGVRL